LTVWKKSHAGKNKIHQQFPSSPIAHILPQKNYFLLPSRPSFGGKMRVLVTDGAAPLCGEILRDSGIEVVENHEINAAELARQIGDFDGIVLRSRSKITAETLAQPGRLKVIGRAGAGVDNIDIKAARGKNIHVMNTPGGNTNAVAELAIAYLFALVRHLPRATATLRDGLWEKKKLAGSEIAGKTLGPDRLWENWPTSRPQGHRPRYARPHL
jgi:hypothetical protein